MSIFSSIMSKIFGTGEAKAAEPAMGGATPTGTTTHTGASTSSTTRPMATTAAAPQAGAQFVDVEAVLIEKAKHNPQKLDWKHSIVDLMKLLDLDSSLSSRKDLAKELGYTGSTEDSAAMNIWLHKQVMKKLAENGGKVPAELAA